MEKINAERARGWIDILDALAFLSQLFLAPPSAFPSREVSMTVLHLNHQQIVAFTMTFAARGLCLDA